MKTMRMTLLWTLTSLGLVACSGESEEPSNATTMTTVPDAPMVTPTRLDLCEETDVVEGSQSLSPWLGPGATQEGQLLPLEEGPYILAATVLGFRGDDPEVGDRFGALMDPIMGELMANEGLVAVRLSTSMACGTARTISIWRDTASMLKFATSEAHGQAVVATPDVSDLYKTTFWEADASEAQALDLAAARVKLAAISTKENP